MKRPIASSRPIGPVVGRDSGFMQMTGGKEVSHTILLGMKSGPAPSMAGLEDDFVNSMEFMIPSNTKLEEDDFKVFSESIVARELGNGSLWTTVIKLYRDDLLMGEVRSITDEIIDVMEDLGFEVQDEHIVSGDYFK